MRECWRKTSESNRPENECYTNILNVNVRRCFRCINALRCDFAKTNGLLCEFVTVTMYRWHGTYLAMVINVDPVRSVDVLSVIFIRQTMSRLQRRENVVCGSRAITHVHGCCSACAVCCKCPIYISVHYEHENKNTLHCLRIWRMSSNKSCL